MFIPMAERATTPEAIEAKREVILDAALSNFAERGYHGTSVPSIAKGAQVGAGTLYRYFDSKETLVNALFVREKERVLAFVMEGYDPATPPRDQFHHFWDRITTYGREHSESFRFLEHHHHAPYLDDASRGLEARVRGMAVGLIGQVQALRVFKPVAPDAIVTIVWGTVVMLMKEHFTGQCPLTAALIQQTEDLCWEAIRL